METRTASSAAVSEVLNVDNYLVWRVQVKTYLIAQDLWGIVENDEASFKDWSKKNAMALHVIQISCPQRICHVISLITSAKIAWETLELICSIPKSDYFEEKEESYEAWSNRMNKILRKHNLRKIVETTNEPTTPNWSKDALALYLIRESCGSDRFSLIEKISKAEEAWDTCAFNSGLSIISLDDVEKYKDWSLQVKTQLKCEQLWDIVEGTDEPPKTENDNDPAIMAWSHKNNKALSVIRRDCLNEFYDATNNISSAKIVWDTLATICTLPKTAFEFLADDGNNYLDWTLKMKAILMDRQLWDIVEGTLNRPKEEKNNMALILIKYSCYWFRFALSKKHGNESLVSDKLTNITSAKIVWYALPKTDIEGHESIPTVFERLASSGIEHLVDVENYWRWSTQVKMFLGSEDLLDIVENNQASSERNAKALAVIVFFCGYHLRVAIWGITSAKVTWDTLAEICSFRKSDYIVSEGYDYVAWSIRMEAYLKEQNLWGIVEAATEPPKPEDEETAFNDWSKKNAIALYLIWESSDAFFSFKKSTRTAQIAWDTLAEFGKSGGIRTELRKYKSFRQNLRDGNWSAANQFITSCPVALSAIIANTGSTALHIAILAGHLQIVKELVNMLPTDKLLEIKDKDGNTVLGYCALVGTTKMAECIVDKCPNLLGIANGPHALIPVVMALKRNSNSIAMARYLFPETDLKILSPGKGSNGATFVTRCIYSKAFDMASNALEKFPTLVTALDIENESPVLALASMSFAYTRGNRLRFWTRWIRNYQGSVWNLLKFREFDRKYELKFLPGKSKELLLRMCEVLVGLDFQQLENGKVIEAIVIAVKQGRVEFVTEILKALPELAWSVEKSTGQNIFMLAVLYRQDEIFHFLCKSPAKYSILALGDRDRNTILHIAAMFEPSAKSNKVPGAAFLMQREVQWYKEVERLVHPFMLEYTNTNGKRPRELFTESHKELVEEGEKWMKETSSSCTVVAALIVTIMFAAAITVPGGQIQDVGLPIFLNEEVFMVFIISDALSLLSASTSLLMFLGILTSRYAEEDFLKSLPKRMIVGLSTLILSIATMMITFCASLFIVLPGKSWVVIPIFCLAGVPVTLFAWMEFRLLMDMVISTYARMILDKKA